VTTKRRKRDAPAWLAWKRHGAGTCADGSGCGWGGRCGGRSVADAHASPRRRGRVAGVASWLVQTRGSRRVDCIVAESACGQRNWLPPLAAYLTFVRHLGLLQLAIGVQLFCTRTHSGHGPLCSSCVHFIQPSLALSSDVLLRHVIELYSRS
jgi:hypothetical protein